MDKAIMQLGETYEYTNATDAALYFTDEFLPAGGFSLK
jgi:NitT/TauT family transport system substrate-binding protein